MPTLFLGSLSQSSQNFHFHRVIWIIFYPINYPFGVTLVRDFLGSEFIQRNFWIDIEKYGEKEMHTFGYIWNRNLYCIGNNYKDWGVCRWQKIPLTSRYWTKELQKKKNKKTKNITEQKQKCCCNLQETFSAINSCLPFFITFFIFDSKKLKSEAIYVMTKAHLS